MISSSKTLIRLLLAALTLASLAKTQNQAPKIEQHPLSVIVNVTDPVTLECRASGTPTPQITWYKDGKQLHISSSDLTNGATKANKYALIHDSSLFIFSATLGRGDKTDTGVYTCRASNDLGVAVSSNATILITYLKEDFREVPKSRQVNAGSVVNMECKAPRGFPEPVVWWEKDGVPLHTQPAQTSFYAFNNNKIVVSDVGSTSYFAFVNGSLVIGNASVVDNGEYVCVAKNEAGVRKTGPARLNVFEKPNFIIQPETSKYQAGARVELECEASGFPRPQIEWKKDNSIENLPMKYVAILKINVFLP